MCHSFRILKRFVDKPQIGCTSIHCSYTSKSAPRTDNCISINKIKLHSHLQNMQKNSDNMYKIQKS